MPPGSDDDHESRPHPGPSDRPWFHPSELPLDAGAPPRRRPSRRFTLPAVAGLVSALVAAGIVALSFDPSVGRRGDGRQTATASVAPTFLLPAGSRGAVSVPVVEVLAWEGPRVRYGSGVVYGEDGLVVTAASVVAGAATVEVRHADEQVTAEVVGTDPENDLALLRTPLRVPPAGFPSASRLDEGERCFVVALTAHGGQIGLLAGSVEHTEVVRAVGGGWLVGGIEFEAASGSAAAGGALLDGDGTLAGVVTSLRSERGGRPLAVPAATVTRSVEALLADGHVHYPWLGIAVQDDPEAAGPVVVGVAAGSPAHAAGLAEGDVVVSVAGQAVVDTPGLMRAVRSLEVGAPVTVTYQREGVDHDATVTAAVRHPG